MTAEELESRVLRLEESLEEIRARLAKLESRGPIPPHATAPAPARAVPQPSESASDIGLAGICVLILGGAFLVRAVTESAILPQLAGVVLGLAYAAIWIWNADRLSRTGRRRAAIYHSLTAALIAYPLVWETTVRFRILSPAAASAILTAISVLFLWTAWRTDHELLAWIGNVGCIIVAFPIAKGIQTAVPLLVAVSAVGAATLYLSFSKHWRFTPWLPAAAANVLALIAVVAKGLKQTPGNITAPLLGFVGLWLLPIAVRRVRFREEPTLFEITQSANVLLIGVGGAVAFARGFALGATFSAVGLSLCVLFFMPPISTAAPRLRTYVSSVGAYLLAVGTWMIAPNAATVSLIWAAAAVAAAEIARRTSFRAMAVQSTLWIAAAAIAGGVILSTIGAFIGTGEIELSPSALAVGVLALIAFIRLQSVPLTRIVPLAVFICMMLSGLVSVISSAAAVQQPALLALVRTGVLAAAAALLAVASRLLRIDEASILARAILVLGGVKLIAEDVRVGRAAILVVAFALYGGAMLIVARSGVRSR